MVPRDRETVKYPKFTRTLSLRQWTRQVGVMTRAAAKQPQASLLLYHAWGLFTMRLPTGGTVDFMVVCADGEIEDGVTLLLLSWALVTGDARVLLLLTSPSALIEAAIRKINIAAQKICMMK